MHLANMVNAWYFTYESGVAGKNKEHHENNHGICSLEWHHGLIYKRHSCICIGRHNLKQGEPKIGVSLVPHTIDWPPHHAGRSFLCCIGGTKFLAHLGCEIYGAITVNATS